MVSTDSPSNLPLHEVPNPAAVIEELMYVPPNTQQEHRRVAGKAVTILPRPSSGGAMKQNTPSPPLNGQVLAAAQVQPITPSQPVSSNSAQQQQQQSVAAPTMKCQTNKLGSRKMTHEIEEEVLANWGEHVTEYYEGIRRRVFKKIALKLNEMLQEEPFYTEKQVENKITYMEKRYKSVKDKFSASGFGVEDLTERSMRTQVERMFPLFFKVHQIIGRRATIAPAATTAATAATVATAAAAIDISGQNLNGAGDSTATNRGRKRKRTPHGATDLEARNDHLVTTGDPAVTDVPILEDSDDGIDAGDVIVESDGSPRDNSAKKRKKQTTPESNRRPRRKAKARASDQVPASDSILKATLKQIENDERHRKEMLQVMRTEVQLKQVQLEMEKKNMLEKSVMSKAIEMRKLAEIYANIDDKDSAKQLLDESYGLLSKL